MVEKCVACKKECKGGFEVSAATLADGTLELSVYPTPDRDFNVCDLCSRTTCFACSTDADSGYCNDCHARLFNKP